MDNVEKTEKEILNYIHSLKGNGSNNDYLLAEWAKNKLEVYQSEKLTLNTCLKLAHISEKCSIEALSAKPNTEIEAKNSLHYPSFVHGDPFMLTYSPDMVPLF